MPSNCLGAPSPTIPPNEASAPIPTWIETAESPADSSPTPEPPE